MRNHENKFPVGKMAKLLNVSKSGYYNYIKRSPSTREQENVRLIEKIKQVYSKGRGVYGSPRIHRELKKEGEACSRRRVARLMNKHGIRAKTNKSWKKRKKPILWSAPNLLNQDFNVSKPDEVWVSDITQVKTLDGWLYVATVLDLFSKKIIGLSMNSRMKVDLVKNALNQAVLTRRPTEEVIHHSDRGSQYTSEDFRMAAEGRNIILSMNSGSCYDNAVMESFFHTLKTECVYLSKLNTRDITKNSLFEFIEVFYNRERSHSTLGYVSPVQFEKNYFENRCLCS
jgi:putative transposase